ncbi:hypothetical protein L917_02578 [Phytophthora nicotianae]|uniref:Uncharacterized protein n=1 Tax=Phytophthora nicotianae TaxID=4792 RepID=W2LVS6_PHYNI|nr:hypothetical protein L917_02578 [Phytophthora nicotianae]
MKNNQLCLQFGVPPATLSRAINAAEKALRLPLQECPLFRITWPSLSRQRALSKLVSLKQPLLTHAWGFLDGKNYRVQSPSDTDLQNANYNG